MLRTVLYILVKVFAILLFAAGALGVAVWAGNEAAGRYTAASTAEVSKVASQGEPVTIVIGEGASAGHVLDMIADAGVTERNELEILLERRNLTEKLRAGEYTMTTGMAAIDVVELLVTGPELSEYTVTLIEGLRTKETLQRLAQQTPYTYAEYYNILTAGGVQSAYLPRRSNLDEVVEYGHDVVLVQWEGLLAPDTYQFSSTAPAWKILQTLADAAVNKIDSVDWRALRAAGYQVYDGLKIASLIESEVRLEEERPTVSGVIWNRLNEGMLLGIDATTLYAADVRGRAPNSTELRSEDPYNTRKVRGLPPTPIAGVRLSSLQAAGQPETHNYLYYVVIGEGGRHGFAETLEEFAALKAEARRKGYL